MEGLIRCTRCRLALTAFAVLAWVISIVADVFYAAGWSAARAFAADSIIAGIIAMFLAAAVSAYDLGLQTDRAAKAELLDAGVMLAASLLFAFNLMLRSHSDSVLPWILSLIAIVAVVSEFYVDWMEWHVERTRRTPAPDESEPRNWR